MTEHHPSEILPGLSLFEDLLPKVIALGSHQLRKHLERERRLALPDHDPDALRLIEDLGEAYSHVRFAAGWSVPEVLHVIGCRKSAAPVDINHLQAAMRNMRRLAESVTEVADLGVDPSVVNVAFRQPAGDPDAPLRSMSDEAWSEVFLDARDFATRLLLPPNFDLGHPFKDRTTQLRTGLASIASASNH